MTMDSSQFPSPPGTPVIERLLNLRDLLQKKSFFLFGPRQTGKTFWVRRSLGEVKTYDLLDTSVYLALSRSPSRIAQELSSQDRVVVIDEIQRLPSLLNTIQALMDAGRPPMKYYLTGSSARKLKRGGANLLPGRLHMYHLGPLVASELAYQMNASQTLETGTLPGIWTEADARERRKTLQTYAATYLKEEIQAEETILLCLKLKILWD